MVKGGHSDILCLQTRSGKGFDFSKHIKHIKQLNIKAKLPLKSSFALYTKKKKKQGANDDRHEPNCRTETRTISNN